MGPVGFLKCLGLSSKPMRQVNVVIISDQVSFGIWRCEGCAGVSFLAKGIEAMWNRHQSPAIAGLVLVLPRVVQDHQFAKFAWVILPQKALDQLTKARGT